MTWLLRLYPPRWRQRYGEEFMELMASQRFTPSAAIDVIAGAIDAWIHPELSAVATTPTTRGESRMLQTLRLKCAGRVPIAREDVWKSNAVAIGGSLLLTLIWFLAARRYPDNSYVEALWPMAYMIPLLFSQRYTALRGHSAAAQWVFILGFIAILTSFLLLIGWVAERF